MNEFFVADQEMFDSLKMEVSALTPEQDKMVENFGNKVSDFIRDKYGNYIPEDKKSELVDIGKRIVITEKSTYQVFSSEWDGEEVGESSDGARFLYGEFIGLNKMEDAWDRLASEDTRQSFIKRYAGDELNAKKAFEFIVITNYTIHEIVHMFQNDELPEVLLETATRYYQQKIALELIGSATTFGEPYDGYIDKYQKLIDQYGDEVHKVFFGSAEDHMNLLVETVFNKNISDE